MKNTATPISAKLIAMRTIFVNTKAVLICAYGELALMLVVMKADSVDLRPQILRYKINPFDMYDQNPQQFTVHKALERVNLRQNRKLLQIDEEGWKKFIGIMNFYDRLSHPSILAAATTRKF